MWRAIPTILIIALAFIGSLVYVAFYATGLSVWQQIIIVVVTLIAAMVVVAILWIIWWMPYVGMMKRKDWQKAWK